MTPRSQHAAGQGRGHLLSLSPHCRGNIAFVKVACKSRRIGFVATTTFPDRQSSRRVQPDTPLPAVMDHSRDETREPDAIGSSHWTVRAIRRCPSA